MLQSMIIMNKGSRQQLGDHLNQSEIDCRCYKEECSLTMIADSLLRSFYGLRDEMDCTLSITSGFRCQLHNAAVEGKVNSKHTIGFALDIVCPYNMPIQQFQLLAIKYFDTVVAYKADNFVHCQNNF